MNAVLTTAAVHDDAKELLSCFGEEVDRVWRVESAGDSGEGCDTILFTRLGGGAMTAFVEPAGDARLLTVAAGW